MMQVTHNKHELLELIEQEGSQPLSMERIRNLHYLGGANNALCRIRPDEPEEEHWEHKGYAEHTTNSGHMEPVKPAAHP